ncbi:MAG: GNAT family N-acetyltransferase [Chloroflexota bacterium]
MLINEDFHNGRAKEQLKTSFENSFAACVVMDNQEMIGTDRVLSDGVYNAYLMDVWTLTAYLKQGIATKILELLQKKLPGQQVYLFTDEKVSFYKKFGFVECPAGLENWLNCCDE